MSDKQTVIRVCNEPPCAQKGSGGIIKIIEQAVGLVFGSRNEKYDLGSCGCLGSCEFGPNLLVNNNLVVGVNKNNVMEEINKAANVTAISQEEKQAKLEKALDEDLLGDLI